MTEQPISSLAAFVLWVEPGESDYEAWLDEEILPSLRSADGALSAARHGATDQPGLSMLLAWFGDVDAARAATADRISETTERGAGRLAPGGGVFRCRSAFGDASALPEASTGMTGMLTARLRVQDGAAADARAWLDGEHAPRQLTVDGALSYHGLEPLDTEQDRLFLNLWGLQTPAIADSDDWGALRDTPWRTEFWQNVDSVTRGLFALSH